MGTDLSCPARACTVILPLNAAGVRREIPALFDSFTAPKLTICADEALPISSVISVQCGDAMFLGEVATCKAQDDRKWSVGVRVKQILSGLEGLMSLRARLLGDPLPEPMATPR